ncbi:MAG TPA: alpha-2-macroglobulin family protein, partial [Terriglobia bacterium]|nr:alpha-2-macroglobulin family protein [Terriglobia bacterium]
APRFVESPFLDASCGAVYVAVMDSSGALIPGVKINLRGPGEREITGITGEEGYSFLRNIDPGMYELRASLPGFRTKVLTGVFVRAGVITRVVATLDVASTATTVEVAISADTLYTTAASSVGEVVTTHGSSALRPTSTPRLREYFPETLLWQPAVEAKGGAAEVRFKLADSMTTWKAVTIASTKDGRIAVDEKEIVAFQPFFLEHDPPKLLTDGDQIALPVVVRSYLDRDQSIELSMKKEEWFEPLGDASRNLNVKAGDFTREVFPFKAIKPVDSGKQRVTALGSAASDAIEKTSTVLPFGREVTQVSSGIFRTRSTHNFTVPGAALPGSVRAQLKIYPNLMAHVADSIEGIMQRPYGCAEQVISSAYPSLLFLNYARQTGRLSDPLAKKAMRYLEIALQSLRGYQSDEGGFSYWTRGEPDVAVTAYALQFLAGAEEFIEFDDDFSYDALHWLTDRQTSDGSWLKDPKLTAYVVSVLSVPGVGPADKNPVTHGLAYLEKLSLQTAEPYLTASTALAALQAGNKQVADTALSSLRSRVRYEKDAAFWNLETNTPFYGWGVPGRVETTALVVRALAAGKADQDLVDKGLLFLMRNKDRYGVWNSTQATVRVLEALVHLVGDGPAPDRPGSANILVNGAPVSAVNFGTRQQPYNPVIVDLSRFLKPGANTVEIVEQKKAGTATIQLVQSHYIPWNRSAGDLASGPLRLSVRFDKQEAAINESITVAVEAERIGFRGYGMMLAEIGLPPGADVDRESLTTAVASSGWDLSRYDVMPDRVIVYVWPRGGGTKFEFKFRPRYGLEAHSPASKLYDYYNPDAYAILPPEHFTVR